MRDIRSDLKERLQRIDADAEKLRAELNALTQKRNSIQALLTEEEARFAKTDQMLFAGAPNDPGKYATPLSKLILGKIRLNGGQASLDELKEAAEQAAYDFGEKTPGRSIHFALIGMAQGGLVEALGNGVWKLKEVRQVNSVH